MQTLPSSSSVLQLRVFPLIYVCLVNCVNVTMSKPYDGRYATRYPVRARTFVTTSTYYPAALVISDSIDMGLLTSALDTMESAIASQGGWSTVARRVRSSFGDLSKRFKETLTDTLNKSVPEVASERQDNTSSSTVASDVTTFYIEKNASGTVRNNRMIEIVSLGQLAKKKSSSAAASTSDAVAVVPVEEIKSCRIYGQPGAIDDRLKKYSHIKPTLVTPGHMKNISDRCEEYFTRKIKMLISTSTAASKKGKDRERVNVTQSPGNGTEASEEDDVDEGDEEEDEESPSTPSKTSTTSDENDEESNLLKGVAIFPGTKWCGAGDIAENYDDLGNDKTTDSCCREHDHCNDSIKAGKSKYGLKNTDSYTKSSCDCDDKFYTCLQNAKSFLGDQVGRTYFNLLQSQCFKKDYPIISCNDVKGFVFNTVRKACQSYQLDTEREKVYQFFDAKFYIGQHGPLFNIPVISGNIDPILKNVKNVTINGGIIGSIIG